MNHTIRERNVLRLVHSQPDLLDEIEHEAEPIRRPVPTRIAVLIYAIGFACLLCLILGVPR